MGRIDLDHPLARGPTADVYGWHDGHVLKLFHDGCDLEAITYEAQIAKTIHGSGPPVPGVGEIVRVNGRSGLVYERVEGRLMLEEVQRDPASGSDLASRLGALHHRMHTQPSVDGLPLLRGRLHEKTLRAQGLSPAVRSAALNALEAMPVREQHLCHRDFHPGNVNLSPAGDVVIDWVDASLGEPLADVARTSVLLSGAESATQDGPQSRLIRDFQADDLACYVDRSGVDTGEYRRWIPIVAAARLSEGVTEDEPWLVAEADKLTRRARS